MSEEPWVWIEGESATLTCMAGCTGPWSAKDELRQPRWWQPLTIAAEDPNGPPIARRHELEGAVVWERPLEPFAEGGTSRAPRIIECETGVFAVIEDPTRPRYRLYELESATGEIRGDLKLSHGEEPVGPHQVQLACHNGSSVRVFGRVDNDGATSVYVDEVDPNARLAATRTILDPPVDTKLDDRDPAKTALTYRVSGGLKGSSLMGVDPPDPSAEPNPLIVEASAEGQVWWSADLGAVMASDVQVVEAGAITVVRIGASLTGLDPSDGAVVWTALSSGGRHELLQRPEEGLGLWGCSGCLPPSFQIWIEAGKIMISETGEERWLNVIEPRDGRVLARRIWY